MFALLFSYLNKLQKPFLQSKLNIWEFRNVCNGARIAPLIEFLIATSTTFTTKWIKVTRLDLTQAVVWGFFTYHVIVLLLWVAA